VGIPYLIGGRVNALLAKSLIPLRGKISVFSILMESRDATIIMEGSDAP
jgi:hypothetical protein